MKKLKFLFVLFISVLIVPFSVLAKDNKPVNVYFFYGNGCSYCAAAESYFKSLEKEMGDKFNIVEYETWYDQDNVELMEKVADLRNEEPGGVPYIIIGNQSWDGYASSYNDEIESKINSEYKKSVSDRYDIMNYVEEIYGDLNSSSVAGDIAGIIIIVLVVGGIVFGIGFARKKAA